MAISIQEHSQLLTSKVIDSFKEVQPVREGFSGLFPPETTPTLYVDITVRRGTAKAAVDVQRFAEGSKRKLSVTTEKKYLPPYYKLDYDYSKEDIYLTTAAFGVTGNATANKLMRDNALEAVMSNKDEIMRAIRIQQADVLQTGIVKVKNGDNIDYKRKAASIVNVDTLGDYWSVAATATPVTDIQKGLKFLREVGKSGGLASVNVVMRDAAFSAFIETTQVKTMADFRRIERIDVGMPEFAEATGMAYQGRLAAGDFVVNIWTYNEFYEDAAGNIVYYLDQGNVVMVPTDFQGKTVFGALPAEAMSSVGGVTEMVPTIVEKDFLLRAYSDRRTLSSTLELTSAPLVVPTTIDKIYTMKVLA